MAPADQEQGERVQKSTPAKRIRWATTRVKGPKAAQKRISIFNRSRSKRGADEKKRESGGSDPSDPKLEQNGVQEEEGQDAPNSRNVYFNIPLPASARDEEGRPTQHYARNKIRTAKYTPISFIPKNLYYQFHNIANIYFFIVIILGVRIM